MNAHASLPERPSPHVHPTPAELLDAVTAMIRRHDAAHMGSPADQFPPCAWRLVQEAIASCCRDHRAAQTAWGMV